MAGTQVFIAESSSGYNYGTRLTGSDGYDYYPAIYRLGSEKHQSDRIKISSRPTGKSGSGPYFVAYKQTEYGVYAYWQDDSEVNVNGVLTKSKRRGVTDWNYRRIDSYGKQHEYFSNGSYAYTVGLCSLALDGYCYYNAIKADSENPNWVWFKQIYPQRAGSYAKTFDEAKEKMEKAPWVRYTWDDNPWNRSRGVPPLLSNVYYVEKPQDPVFNFKYGEQDCFDWWSLTGVLFNGYQVAATQSYIEAANSLPQAATNSIATLLESAELLNDLFHGRPPTPKSVKDVWLGYRYQYCTTKADMEEYAEITRRLCQVAGNRRITSRGAYQRGPVSCYTSFDVDAASFLPDSCIDWLETYGFRFSALNMWDMVPYSFVVDWFLHIGDLLESFQKQGDAIKLQTQNVWHVFQTEYDDIFCMFRVPKSIRFTWPYCSYSPASKKTLGKRITDAIALFLC